MVQDLQARLKAAMAHRGYDVARLCKEAGVTYQGVRKAYDGVSKSMQMPTAEKLAKVLRCNKFWLATGEGDPQYDERAANGANGNGGNHSSPSAPEMLQNVSDGPDPHGPYPLISEVQAGVWTEIHDNFQPGDADDWLASAKNLGSSGYMLRVRGKSMFAPGEKYSFAEGMILHVNPDLDPMPGQFVIVRRESATSATFKRYVLIDGTPYLEAINPNWPPEEKFLKLQAGDAWCGVVVSASLEGLP